MGYEFTVGPADLVGVPVSATAQCDVTRYCLVTYVILARPAVAALPLAGAGMR